jgi:2'-5' RNA ligase
MDKLSLLQEHKETIGRPVYEYFFLISPDLSVKKVVKEMKNKLHKEIGLSKADLVSVPHISLFKTRAVQEKLDISRFAEALSKTPAFEITICGHGIFEQYNSKRTLYLKLKEKESVRSIFYNLLESKGDNSQPEFIPHLTIARNIGAESLNRLNLSEFDYHGEFYCDRITVLRKAIYKMDFPLGAYELYDEIHLLKGTNLFFS